MSNETSKDVSNTQTTEIEPENLPKLSPQDHRIYNRLSERMDMFHEHFRQTWTTLFTACSTGRRPSGMSIRQFLSLGDSFCRMLEMHHGIEEQHIFPLLARKMPQFQKSHELLTQHVVIHKGLDELDAYLVACKTGERELRLEEMKGVMDGFGTVLWEHMDDEVRALRAENMSQFWTREEMARLPI
ncbi:unnamed protein product [Zymoseptoria tritici ST99CH_3D1]|nr:unnamed protein product [Zymoseptoria tritici ST99CH_3D1]